MAKIKHHPEASLRIDDYVAGLPPWSAAICRRLREIILKSDPALVEDWKWGPNYYRNGMVCGFYGTKKFVSLMFFQGILLSDPKQILRKNEGTVQNRHLRFTDLNQLDEEVLLTYIMEAIDLNLEGKTFDPKASREEIVLPEAVITAFRQAGVLENYEAMSYFKRKEFRDWIGWAKREETKQKRIGEAIEKLSRKEGWGDHYRKKK